MSSEDSHIRLGCTSFKKCLHPNEVSTLLLYEILRGATGGIYAGVVGPESWEPNLISPILEAGRNLLGATASVLRKNMR